MLMYVWECKIRTKTVQIYYTKALYRCYCGDMSNKKKLFASSILENSTTALLLADIDEKLHYLNPAAEALLNIGEKKALNSQLTATIGTRALQLKNAPYTEYTVGLSPVNAEKILVDVSVAYLEDLNLYLIELYPVTQQIRLVNNEQLISQSSFTKELLRGLAHEIKNPLGGLRGAAQLLALELDDQSLKEYTDIIIAETNRLSSLLDNISGMNRLPQVTTISIHEVLERVRVIVLAEFSKLKLQIVQDYDPSIPELSADFDMLVQATMNITRNAAQHLGAEGKIILRTRVLHKFFIGQKQHNLVCKIEIEDNGSGIIDELQEIIFMPMITGRKGGTGLGLSIAQSIIQKQGGIVECQSQPGETKFTILLPLGDKR